MNTEKVKVKIKLENGAIVPTYATEGSVGFDLKALGIKALYSGAREWPLEVIKRKVADSGKIIVKSFDRALLLTGIYVELPIGTEIQIRPRSGRSLKTGLFVIPGTIDHDYRGEIGIIVVNMTAFSIPITVGDAVAQGVLQYVPKVEWEVTDDLSDTLRGEGGYGHTDETKEDEKP